MARFTSAQAQAMTHFMNNGYTAAQAAGLVGMLQGESGKNLNPNLTGDNGAAYGIAQWHPGRLAYQSAWARSQGLDPNTLEGQLAMVTHELQYGTPNEIGPQADAIKAAKTPYQAAATGVYNFEKPAALADQAALRGQYANQMLDAYRPTLNAMETAANPDATAHLPGSMAADQIDRLNERQATISGTPTIDTTTALGRLKAAWKATMGAVEGLAQPAITGLSDIAINSAANQPNNPSSPDLSTPLGRVQSAAMQLGMGGYTPKAPPAGPTWADVSAGQFDAPPTSMGGYTPSTPDIGPTWGDISNADFGNTPAVGRDANAGAVPDAPAAPTRQSFQPAPPSAPQSPQLGTPTTMPMGFKAPAVTTPTPSLTDYATNPALAQAGVSPQTDLDEANATAQALSDYNNTLAQLAGPAPGTVTQKKPGELGYQAPAPPKPAPAPAPMPRTLMGLAQRHLPRAPPASAAPANPFAGVRLGLTDANMAGAYDAMISNNQPQTGFLGGLANLFGGNGYSGAALGPHDTSDSNAYGHTTYGTQSIGGGGGHTLGGGDNHRAL